MKHPNQMQSGISSLTPSTPYSYPQRSEHGLSFIGLLLVWIHYTRRICCYYEIIILVVINVVSWCRCLLIILCNHLKQWTSMEFSQMPTMAMQTCNTLKQNCQNHVLFHWNIQVQKILKYKEYIALELIKALPKLNSYNNGYLKKQKKKNVQLDDLCLF